MPQLTFEFQQNGDSTENPSLETLATLMEQCKINYDDMQQQNQDEEDSSFSVLVDFQDEENSTKALDNLNGIEFMGSSIVVKLNQDGNSFKNRNAGRGYNREHRGGIRQNNRRYGPRFNRGNNFNQNFQQQQPQKMEQYPCRLLIPGHMVKVVLGKSGSTITAIQSKTSTKIDIHRDKGAGHTRQPEEILVSIKGEPTAFSNAIKELLLVMNTELEKDEEEEEGEENQEEVVKAPLQLKLLAHDLLCGRIIGKGGNNLKQVRQDSGVNKLIISNSIYDESGQFGPNGMMVSLGERVVTIEGTVDAICEAEKIISQRLRDYMEKDLRNSANNPNMNNPYYGGQQMGNFYGGNAGAGAGGYPQMQMMYPRSPYNNPYQMQGYFPYPSPYANNYPGLLGQGYPPFTGVMASPPQALYGEEETCAIIIPTKEVGAIIGRNGNYINKVKQYSHAQVRVVKGEDSGESRVEVRGSPDAQWRASLCIFGKIKETMKVPYSEAQLKTEFMVNGNCVGRIIGKKGQVVQDIQDKAQTDIEVPKDKQGGEDVPVYITGTFNGTQMALNRIRDIMQRARTKPMSSEE